MPRGDNKKASGGDGEFSSRRLNTYVTVHPENEASVTYGPDDQVPAHHVALIQNPNVWVKEKPSEVQSDPNNPNNQPPVNYREVTDDDVLRAMATDKGIKDADTLDREALIQALEATTPPSTDTPT